MYRCTRIMDVAGLYVLISALDPRLIESKEKFPYKVQTNFFEETGTVYIKKEGDKRPH